MTALATEVLSEDRLFKRIDAGDAQACDGCSAVTRRWPSR